MQPICIIKKKVMPTNKNAAFRYRVLNACFRRPKKWTIQELQGAVSEALQEAFGVDQVSIRTLANDISLMRSLPPRGYAAPILCEQGQYFYADRNFSILDQPLSETDLDSLREAAALLSQFKGLPVAEGLVAILQRLEGWSGSPDQSVIQFESNDLTTGLQWLKPLYEAIVGQQPLKMEYQPFVVEEPLSFVFHPYHLREFRNRWFVFGLNETTGTIYNLALDRILAFSTSDSPYVPNNLFDPVIYFQDIIGVTRIAGAEPVEIQFRTSLLQSKYLQTKPLHASQVYLGDTEQGALFSIRVIPNYELYADLLRMGKALEVLSPEEVKLVVHPI